MNFCPQCYQSIPYSKEISVIYVKRFTNRVLRNRSIEDTKYAGLLKRFLARLIDYQLISLLYLLCDQMTYGVISSDLQWFTKQITVIPTQTLSLILFFLLFAGYFIFFHTLIGQTLGKHICSIRVNHITKKSPPSPFESLLREIACLFSLMIGGWPILFVFFSNRRRSLHDWLSRSIVKLA